MSDAHKQPVIVVNLPGPWWERHLPSIILLAALVLQVYSFLINSERIASLEARIEALEDTGSDDDADIKVGQR